MKTLKDTINVNESSMTNIETKDYGKSWMTGSYNVKSAKELIRSFLEGAKEGVLENAEFDDRNAKKWIDLSKAIEEVLINF